MSKDNTNQALKEYSNRKKRYKKRRNIIIITLILILAVAAVAYFINLYNKNYQNYKVIKSTEIKGESAVGYRSYGNAVIKYGKDGAIAYNKDGGLLWNGSYEMMDPMIDICGKYVVIADRGNKSVHIYNQKGKAGNFETEYNILKAEVASQGAVAVLMQEGDTNYIKVYNGSDRFERGNTINNSGYPMDISLSEDGKKLAVTYLTVSEGDIVSTVVFYNLSEIGESSNNLQVGAYKFKKGIVLPDIEFLNNDTVVVYKNNGFVIYSIKQIPKDIKEVNLKGKILSILHNKNKLGVVLETKEGASRHLLLYDLKGKQILDKTLDFEYKKIFLTDTEIIMYDDLTCIVMKENGKEKFKHTFEGDIVDFYPVNNLDRYLLINEAKLSGIQLTE